MPRTGKGRGPGGAPGGQQNGGYGAASIEAMGGRPYGEEAAMADAAATVRPGPSPAPSTPVASPAAAPPAAPDRRQLIEQAMRQAGRMRPTTPLFAASERPNEPFTAGMSMGAGPGPEVLSRGNRVSRTLQQMAAHSGNPRFAELAALAASRGR